MSPGKKFSLRQVYELRKHLGAGKKMNDLIEMEPIKDFLVSVIDNNGTVASGD